MANPVLDLWYQIGEHSFRTEEPDIFHLRIVGDVSGPEMGWILEEYDLFSTGKPTAFWISDASRLGDLSPEARKLAARSTPSGGVTGAVIFGASFRQRVMSTLLVKTAALFRKPEEVVPVVFTQTEAEGYAWMDARRREVRMMLAG